ncbi:MAG TPA: FAD-dependent oxidoreductase [Polyangiaceae bacterium]
MARVGVIGGGLAGLVVAYRRAAAGDDVVLLESGVRLGGQLHTERSDGFIIEHGAEGFVASSAAVPKLADDLGIEGDLIGQRTLLSYGFDGAQLIALAPGEAGAFLGFQVPTDDLGRGIRTLRLGMAELSDVLAGALVERVVVDAPRAVTGLALHRDAVQILRAGASPIEVDAAVIAAPARGASALLASAPEPVGSAARALAAARVASILTVSLAYPRETIDHPLDGTGFVVADPAKIGGLRACTFTSSKFDGRAPADRASLRAFFRPDPADIEKLDDAAWIARADDSIRRVLRVESPPLRGWVSRWSSALPVFNDDHRAKVATLEAALTGRRVWLAGSAFHGSGIDRAVRSAEACALSL